jgi:hypothetical protein
MFRFSITASPMAKSVVNGIVPTTKIIVLTSALWKIGSPTSRS